MQYFIGDRDGLVVMALAFNAGGPAIKLRSLAQDFAFKKWLPGGGLCSGFKTALVPVNRMIRRSVLSADHNISVNIASSKVKGLYPTGILHCGQPVTCKRD